MNKKRTSNCTKTFEYDKDSMNGLKKSFFKDNYNTNINCLKSKHGIYPIVFTDKLVCLDSYIIKTVNETKRNLQAL